MKFYLVGSSPLHIPCFEFRFVELSAFPYIKFCFIESPLEHNTPSTSIKRSIEIPDICHSTKAPFTFTFDPEDLAQRVELFGNFLSFSFGRPDKRTKQMLKILC